MALTPSRHGGADPRMPRSAESGTLPALNIKSKSHPASRKTICVNGWGGARNSGTRASDCLSLKQARGVIRAAHNAHAIGLPFNRHLTIHWERAGVPDDRQATATGAFLTLGRDWLRKRGARFAWSFVRESGDGKGGHAHILMHVPPDLAVDFGRRQRSWIKRVTGRRYRTGTIRTARIGGTLRAAWTAPAVYDVNLGVVVAYLLKGASRAAGEALGVPRLEPGGSVIGKRAGWSENLGAASVRTG